jgi:hypothetical protein
MGSLMRTRPAGVPIFLLVLLGTGPTAVISRRGVPFVRFECRDLAGGRAQHRSQAVRTAGGTYSPGHPPALTYPSSFQVGPDFQLNT